MVIAIILVLFAVALFLIFHDDHDDSYTRREKSPGRQNEPKSTYQKSTPRPSQAMDSRTVVPKEKEYRPRKLDERYKPEPAEPRYASAPSSAPRNDARPAGFAYEKKVLAAAGTEKLYEPAAAPLNWQDLLQQFTSSLPKSDTQAVMEFAETHSDIVVMAYAG